MNTFQSSFAQQSCERILLDKKKENLKGNILAAENIVIDRLLARKSELSDAYEELYYKLHKKLFGLDYFLNILICAAANSSPITKKEMALTIDSIFLINQKISDSADLLEKLLNERDILFKNTDLNNITSHPVCLLLIAGGQHNFLFKAYVQEKLLALNERYDRRYWPSISDLFREVSTDALNCSNNLVHALPVTSEFSDYPSRSVFFNKFFAAIEHKKTLDNPPLPDEFRLTNRSLAALANCALDLAPEYKIDSNYMKQLHQVVS